MRSGIYMIRHKTSHRLYVGSAVDIDRRWSVHLCELRKGTHHSYLLQHAWNRFGEDAFEWLTIEHLVNVNQLLDREQYWLDHYQSYLKRFGYNICKVAGSQLGRKRSEMTKLIQSQVAKERNADPVYNKMISDRCKAQWQDPEFVAAVERGRPKINPNKGKPMSEAQKQILREKALLRREQMVAAAKKSVLVRGYKLRG